MSSFTTSSIPANATLRHSKTLIVIPLLSSKHTYNANTATNNNNNNNNNTNKSSHHISHSTESFKTLFSSLAHINLERDIPQKSNKSKSKEITLIIPNANLTPPGEWRYDTTPLKSHDWSIGCQKLMFVDGTQSLYAQERLKAFANKRSNASKSSYYGEFTDLYPSRGIAAVVGVLNVNDCRSVQDLHRAEEELEAWTERFTPILYAQKDWDEAFDSPIAPKHFVQKRLFAFDSFSEGNSEIDLAKSTLKPGELIAFPPTENMDLHLNVVVNDLCVSTFMDLERRIRVLDGLAVGNGGNDDGENGNTGGKDQLKSSGIGDVATIVGSNSNFNVVTPSEGTGDGNDDSDTAGESTSEMGMDGRVKITVKKRGFRGLAANAVKALNSRNALVPDACAELPPIEHELQTPIDVGFDEAKLTSRDIENIFKRNAARREKHAADLALLAGSAMDAYDRYTRAAEASKKAHDPLWYAAALEGIATSFIAMSDTGGHGADFYLENNFQYPDDIMSAALSIIGNVEEGKDTTKIDKSKTTMPRAVSALLEEAYGIMSRNAKLSSIASELLLKIAWYTAELEGLHLRCRWGEGFSGGDDQHDEDEHTMTAAINGSQKRWEMTSVSKIDLDFLRSRGKLDANLSKATAAQCQRFTESLHKAVNNGGIDPYTRACVAARSAKLCLKGIRGPYWGPLDKRISEKRHTLPRKAAFFTTIAAESMSQCKAPNAQNSASGFWAAASHLYSKDGNKFDGNNLYAWASLRSTIFHAMSLYGGMASSEKAISQLLLLLGECSSKAQQRTITSGQSDFNLNKETDSEQLENPLEEPNNADVIIKVPMSRGKSTTMPVRSSLFPHISNSNAMIEQSKWVDEDAVSPIMLPLIEPSSKVAILKANGDIEFLKKASKSFQSFSPLIFLNSVTAKMDFDVCIAAQKKCISILANLRKSVPTISPDSLVESAPSQADDFSSNQPPQPAENPLKIVSAKILKSESHLLDKLKAAGFAGNTKASLATFFNPYANKKTESIGKNLITLVAQGEEKTIMIEFSNNLAVPLDVPSCQLVFEKSKFVDVEAPPLSFTLPPKSDNFAVSFPFTVASLNWNPEYRDIADQDANEVNINQSQFIFGVVGIRVSAFNRSVFIPFVFDDGSASEKMTEKRPSDTLQIPRPISTYECQKKKKSSNDTTKDAIKERKIVSLEAVPAQPNLLISFANAPTPLEDEAAIPVHLSDGEIFTIPPFRLENDFGSSGLGKLERLQIVGVGMPGLPEEILYDTDEVAKALEEKEDRFSDEESESDEFEELFESEGLPPLKMKCLTEGLSLNSINDWSKSIGEGSILAFQVAATHDMGNRIKNGGNVRIRFRYRGPSPTPGIEIWRKREVSLKIVKVKGPRISSLTFRSDLSWGSAYSDLCHSLALQKNKSRRIPELESTIPDVTIDESDKDSSEKSTRSVPSNSRDIAVEKEIMLDNIGKANGVFITKDDIVVLMAVANETNSTIVLSNRAGVVGGFESSPMPTVKVSSGVSVKIPVVIPRIDRIAENGEVVDIANELIAHTSLNWHSEVMEKNDSSQKGTRQGRCRIPSRCLREMIQEHGSFATRICKPPVIINLKVDGKEYSGKELVMSAGSPLDLSLNSKSQEWIPLKSLKKCNVTLEFCCSRKKSGNSQKTFLEENKGAFIWCGQIRKSYQLDENNLKHNARLCILSPGDFVISACVKINRSGNEEIWWAPHFWSVKVSKKEVHHND